MSIRIYSEYDEFNYTEKEVSGFFEDQIIEENYIDYEEDNDSSLFGDFQKSKPNIREDANFYIVSDLEDEEMAEEIASFLGKYTKIYIKELHQFFFYII